jgi:hypothetical protein
VRWRVIGFSAATVKRRMVEAAEKTFLPPQKL